MDDIIATEFKMDKNNDENSADLPILEEMMRLGLASGHKKAKTHPRMKPHIFITRNGAEVIDLAQTLKALESALGFVEKKVAGGAVVLLAGLTPASKTAVEELAKKLGLPYVTERWLGGTLTNFKTLSKRINYFKKLKIDRSAGKFEKYTKKERLDIDREIEKLTIKFSGIENMEGMPGVLFVADVAHHMTAVKEAKIMKIPVVALVNTDINPEIIDYPIPANDRSRAGLEWILAKLEIAIEKGKADKAAAAVDKLKK